MHSLLFSSMPICQQMITSGWLLTIARTLMAPWCPVDGKSADPAWPPVEHSIGGHNRAQRRRGNYVWTCLVVSVICSSPGACITALLANDGILQWLCRRCRQIKSSQHCFFTASLHPQYGLVSRQPLSPRLRGSLSCGMCRARSVVNVCCWWWQCWWETATTRFSIRGAQSTHCLSVSSLLRVCKSQLLSLQMRVLCLRPHTPAAILCAENERVSCFYWRHYPFR